MNFVIANTWLRSVTLDTSHSPTGPREPPRQSPVRDTFRHASMALLSSDFDRGKNAGLVGMAVIPTAEVGVHVLDDIDPDEP